MYKYVCHRIHREVDKMIQNKSYISPLLHSMFQGLPLDDCLKLALHYHISTDKLPTVLFRCFHMSHYVILEMPKTTNTSFLFRV